jgi:hypothetical protein
VARALAIDTAGNNALWHKEPRFEVHTALVPVFQTVRDESSWRLDADELHLGYYKQSERYGVRGHSLRGARYESATLPYNVCRSAVDTLQAKIAKHRPLPQCMTQRGNWSQQKRARKMTEFLEGEFYRQRIYERQAPMIVRDALIFGRGALRIWVEGKCIKTERVLPWELFADEWDSRYGSPRNMFHARNMDRGVALQTFARTASGGWNQTIKQAIEQAGRFSRDDATYTGGATVDRIDVVEAWHLCDRPEEHEPEDENERPEDEANEEADDGNGETRGASEQPRRHKCTGRHVVITTAGTLLDEPWEYDYFPFAVLGFNEAVTGCWATGLVEQLEGYQYELNLTSERLSEMYRLSGVLVTVPDNAKISYQDITNGINIMGHAPGGAPQVTQLDLVNEHVRARPRELTEDALNDAGLSQMSVQSQTPAGLESGVAIRTMDDIETERFIIFGRSYATWNVEVARRLVDCAKLVAKTHGDHSVSVPMRSGLVKMSWNDVYVDGVEIRIDPTSVLPSLLPARLDLLMQMWESQQIDRTTFLRNLETTDLHGEILTELAPKLVVDEMIEAMLMADEEEGEDAYKPPTAYQPFEWAAKRAQDKYNRGLLDGVPEYNLDMLQRYIKHCQKEIEKLTPPAPEPAPANINGMAMPPAPGGPMPGPDPMAAGMAAPAPPMAA